jgi:acid stress-induced BolA-like protein IbaG/YrbA
LTAAEAAGRRANTSEFMMNQEITESILSQMPTAKVEVVLDGNRAVITVVSEEFTTLNRLRRQQKVYGCIGDFISDGRLHAVTIRAVTPQE